ncbi:hypothetical protein [Tumebacillus flagellatus]|nr:hypothetical protein [Tumebacillus flagellatus]
MKEKSKRWIVNIAGLVVSVMLSFLLYLLFPEVLGPYYFVGGFTLFPVVYGVAILYALFLRKVQWVQGWREFTSMWVLVGVFLCFVLTEGPYGPTSWPSVSSYYYEVSWEKSRLQEVKEGRYAPTDDMPFEQKDQIREELLTKGFYMNGAILLMSNPDYYVINMYRDSFFHGADQYVATYNSKTGQLSQPQKVTDVIEQARSEKILPDEPFSAKISFFILEKQGYLFPKNGPSVWYIATFGIRDERVVILSADVKPLTNAK